MEFTFLYLQYFVERLVLAGPILGMQTLLIGFLGLVVGRLESWSRFDAVYWAFVTASTVGYGDFRPLRRFSKILSILIALVGVIFTGIIVALAINAATLSFKEIHLQGDPPGTLQKEPLKTLPQP